MSELDADIGVHCGTADEPEQESCLRITMRCQYLPGPKLLTQSWRKDAGRYLDFGRGPLVRRDSVASPHPGRDRVSLLPWLADGYSVEAVAREAEVADSPVLEAPAVQEEPER